MAKQTLSARIRQHIRNLKSHGATNLALLGETLAHGEAHGDYTPLCQLLATVPEAYGRPLRAILRQVKHGALRADAKQPHGLRYAVSDKPQTEADVSAMAAKRATLGALIAAGESTLGEAVAKAFLGKVDKPDMTLEQTVAALFAKMIGDGADPDKVLATAQTVAKAARAQIKAHPTDAKAAAKGLRAAYAAKPDAAPVASTKRGRASATARRRIDAKAA